MENELQALSFATIVNSTPEAAYYAFTNAAGFRNWLCDQSQVEGRPGGRLYLWWNSGYYVSGVFVSLVPGRAVTFTWLGREEPAETQVQVVFSRLETGTSVALKHFGIGTGEGWEEVIDEYKKGWEKGLENLQSVLETGQDLRVVRRPVLGVLIDRVLSPDEAKSLNLPNPGAIQVGRVVPGSSADAVGILPGDLLVTLGSQPVQVISDLAQALNRYYAGDTIDLEIVRDGQRINLEIELSSRTLPDVPDNTVDLYAAVRKRNFSDFEQIQTILAGASDEEVIFSPQDEVWNIKHNLAHLILAERDAQGWIAALLSDREAHFNSNETVRLEALLQVHPDLKDLIRGFRLAQEETEAMVRRIPQPFTANRRGSYISIGQSLLNAHLHTDQHIEEIRTLLAAARS